MKSSFPKWRTIKLPESVKQPTTMLLETELTLLYSLGKEYFKNQGLIIDAGCFLGGSTIAFAKGVQANTKIKKVKKVIYSYDFFIVESWSIGIYFPDDTPLGMSFEAIFKKNIKAVEHLVKMNIGDIQQAKITQPIEILFIDVAKTIEVNDYIVTSFFPRLIPGHSLVIQQDYLFTDWNGWIHVTMEYFSEYFEILDHTDSNSVVFLYKKQIPQALLKVDIFQSLSFSQILQYQDVAINRFRNKHRHIMKISQKNLIKYLVENNWNSSQTVPAKLNILIHQFNYYCYAARQRLIAQLNKD